MKFDCKKEKVGFEMRVLVISHNVFSTTESMGKTLAGYFSVFKPQELAQLYVHTQVPTLDICSRYFRITDKEAINSIFGGRPGGIVEKQSIESVGGDSRTDSGITATIYQKARKRTPLIYIARNLWWKLSHWNSRQLRKWLDEFSPDCVFLAAGDYAFIYDIALKIAQDREIPLYVSCMDDFYFYNRNSNTALGRIQQRYFMNTVNKAMDYSKKIFCICDKMSDDYSKLFRKECITTHTPTSLQKPLDFEKKLQISYLGNLGYDRYKQLIDIGRVVKSLNLEPNHIDVYSTEQRPKILENMTEKNGIVFHGAVSADEVHRIMGESLAVIHTESFDDNIRQTVRYSVSTKIADSMASGTCIFAYGPKEIASIDYLLKANAAICCTSQEELAGKLRLLIQDDNFRKIVCNNAIELSHNHAIDSTPIVIRKELQP